jgi:uncharacterized protein YjiS (DUF1127 family)
MHKPQCCYATSLLPNRPGRIYLEFVNKTDEFEPRRVMNLIRSYRNWRRYRETVGELSRLTNRELSDLGISRSDIPFVARKAV